MYIKIINLALCIIATYNLSDILVCVWLVYM